MHQSTTKKRADFEQGRAITAFFAHAPLKPAQARGFTLVEVLVALSIMAVMAVMTWRGIDGMVRGQQMTETGTREVMALQTGLAQWRADLDAMMSWPVLAVGAAAPAHTQATVRSLHWDGRVLRITRHTATPPAAGAPAANAPPPPAAGLRVVAWTRHSASGQWLRWQSPTVQTTAAWQSAWTRAAAWAQDPRTLAPAEQGLPQAVAVALAQDWQLHYYRGNAWTNPLSDPTAQAQPGQPGSVQDALPDGIRLTLQLAEGQRYTGTLVLDWVRPSFGGGA